MRFQKVGADETVWIARMIPGRQSPGRRLSNETEAGDQIKVYRELRRKM